MDFFDDDVDDDDAEEDVEAWRRSTTQGLAESRKLHFDGEGEPKHSSVIC